jgi:DNA invertase Pin-like site-specific DNA recombinase
MRILGWCRTASSGDDAGTPITVQRQQIEAWAYTPGHTIVGWICEEGVSRHTPLAARVQIRPWLTVRDGDWDAVVAVELGRISSRVRDVSELILALEEAGKHLITLDDGVGVTGQERGWTLDDLPEIGPQQSRIRQGGQWII